MTDVIGTADWILESNDVMVIIMLGTLRENCFLFTLILTLKLHVTISQETAEHYLDFNLFIKQKCQILTGSNFIATFLIPNRIRTAAFVDC